MSPLTLLGTVYSRFQDSNFPGWSFSRNDVSRKDVSRMVVFPDETFPGQTIPGSSLSRKMIPEWLSLMTVVASLFKIAECVTFKTNF